MSSETRWLEENCGKNLLLDWDQIACVMTKPLPYSKFSCFRSKLNVLEDTLNMREDVESCSCGKSIVDFEAKLAYRLSYSYLQPADMGNELDLLSWQNGYAEEYQHMSIEGWHYKKLCNDWLVKHNNILNNLCHLILF